jgi:hypothetical protein
MYIWAKRPSSFSKTGWTLLPVTLAIGAELGQFFKIVPGTFDVMDLLAYFGAWIAASIVLRRNNQKNSMGFGETACQA